MTRSFADQLTQEFPSTGAAAHSPPAVGRRAARMLEYVGLATSLEDLKVHPGLTTSYNVEVCDEHQAGVLHMSIPISRTMKRRLIHPGEMLREDFRPDEALTVAGLAEALSGPSADCSEPRIQPGET